MSGQASLRLHSLLGLLSRSRRDVVIIKEFDKQQEVSHDHALAIPPLLVKLLEVETRAIWLQIAVRVHGDHQAELQQLARGDESARPMEGTRICVVRIHDCMHEAVHEAESAYGEVVAQGGHGEGRHVVEVVKADHLPPLQDQEIRVSPFPDLREQVDHGPHAVVAGVHRVPAGHVVPAVKATLSAQMQHECNPHGKAHDAQCDVVALHNTQQQCRGFVRLAGRAAILDIQLHAFYCHAVECADGYVEDRGSWPAENPAPSPRTSIYIQAQKLDYPHTIP